MSFSCAGMLLNYSMFLCAMLTSALSTTIVGVLKVDCMISSPSGSAPVYPWWLHGPCLGAEAA